MTGTHRTNAAAANRLARILAAADADRTSRRIERAAAAERRLARILANLDREGMA